MELMTIGQVTRYLGVSGRMLRYYEQAGMIKSARREGYAYRVYDERTVSQIRQIVLLRKLRIPVRQIGIILKNPEAVRIIEIFRENINELDEEITALTTIKDILNRFVKELKQTADLPLQSIISKDDSLFATIDSLRQISINFMEDQTMDKLKNADESLSKIGDVRVIYLPPGAVASAHYIGDDPELHVNGMIDRFVREQKLHKVKPDLRHYGFNHPNPVDDTGFHGYEAWVTIPDAMEVQKPLVKKQFPGGLYAAHMIPFGNFNEWEVLMEWVRKSEKYEFAGDMEDQEHMCGLLDEHLNYISHVELNNTEPEDMQLDLLMPVREKSK